MEVDDLLVPGRPNNTTARTGRFQPNAGKLKRKPKSEPAPEPDAPAPTLSVKKQEDSTIPLITSPSQPSYSTTNITKVEEKSATIGAMDIDPVHDDDEEDRVVREIDVYFNPSPLDNKAELYVMQYPLRPCWRPYELNERCQEVRVKPEQSKLEVDLEINVGNENYDGAVVEPLRLQKQTLSSSKAPLITSYAVGILLGNKLHLNPVHAVVQLRPSIAYLNAVRVQMNNNVTGSEVMASSDKPWISLEYHGMDSPFSSKYRQNMVAEESKHIEFAMSSFDYVNSLCPGTSNDNNRAKGPSKRFLLTLPLEERIKRLFSEGPQVHRFDALKHLAPSNSEEDVLKVLQQHADLVQGLWVAKSSLRCEGVQALARDYILLLFSANPFIQDDQLKIGNSRSSKFSEIMIDALTPLAVRRPGFKNWKFKEHEDLSFIKAHPDIVEDQRRAWSNRGKHIMDAVHKFGRRNTPAMTNNSRIGVPGKTTASDSADQGAKGGLDGTQSSRTSTMSAETRKALPKALEDLFKIHKVYSLQTICQGLREVAASKSTLPKADAGARAAIAAALSVSALPELQSIISQVAIDIHGIYVLKTTNNPSVDPLRSVVINLFCGKEPNAKVKKADIVEAARIALKREISTSEYNKVMDELCVSTKGGAWMLKSGDRNPR